MCATARVRFPDGLAEPQLIFSQKHKSRRKEGKERMAKEEKPGTPAPIDRAQ